MSFYRSDDMEYFKIFMPKQSAWDTMNTLGKHNLIHVVKNENVTAVRPFIQQVKRCDEALGKIKNIQRAIDQKNVGTKRQFISEEQYKNLQNLWDVHEKTGGNEESRLDQTQSEINRLYKYQQQLVTRKNEIKDKLLILRQNIAVVKAGEIEYGQAFFQIKSKQFQNPQHASLFGLNELQVKGFVTEGKAVNSAKRALNRVTRGNSFINQVHYKDIFQSLYPGEQQKSVIFVIYPAKKDSVLDKKVVKLIDNYSKNWQNYALPQTKTNFKESMKRIQQNYSQSQKMFEYTEQEDKKFLKGLFDKVEGQNITTLQYYKFYLLKQREIYSQLNEMTSHANFIDGQIYTRKQDQQQVMQLLHKVGTETQTPIAKLSRQKTKSMPTHFQMTDFKLPAQQIVNTYGVPRYKQANPSFFTTITFPFMFGVMFGDIAHGLIVFLFGIVLTFQSESSSNAVFRALFPYRYLVVLMGFFATYCGFIYNDFLSLTLNLFGSCFNIKQGQAGHPLHRDETCVYPFGLDPAWGVSQNYLNYMNSLKMKLSVIIAVVHMTLGVLVKASNAIYFRKPLDFVFEFIPQIIFLVGLFGYMDFLIIYKWLKPWKLYDPKAPSIITTMINLPLKMGKTDKCCGGQPMWGTYGNTSQDMIQLVLLVVGVLCIPMILFPKPIIEICHIKRKHHKQIKSDKQIGQIVQYADRDSSQRRMINQVRADNHNEVVNNQRVQQVPISSKSINSTTSIPEPPRKKKVKQQGEQDASQIFVHQLIETIQYVLGCISNTASYLRLWALSLAHSQLSEVFFQKTIEGGLAKGHFGIPMLILAFPILAGATFGVLLCMDSMECFLHTLRLHWVEFQNKFYKGDGFIFQPISFKDTIKQNVAKNA